MAVIPRISSMFSEANEAVIITDFLSSDKANEASPESAVPSLLLTNVPVVPSFSL